MWAASDRSRRANVARGRAKWARPTVVAKRAKGKAPSATASGSSDLFTVKRHEPQGELLTPPTGGILPSDGPGGNAESGGLFDAAIRVAAAGIKGGKDKALDAALGEVGHIIKGK